MWISIASPGFAPATADWPGDAVEVLLHPGRGLGAEVRWVAVQAGEAVLGVHREPLAAAEPSRPGYATGCTRTSGPRPRMSAWSPSWHAQSAAAASRGLSARSPRTRRTRCRRPRRTAPPRGRARCRGRGQWEPRWLRRRTRPGREQIVLEDRQILLVAKLRRRQRAEHVSSRRSWLSPGRANACLQIGTPAVSHIVAALWNGTRPPS